MSNLTVVTFLWRDPKTAWRKHYRYGPEHVRRLRSMCARHLSVPHEMACVTDQPDAMPEGVRAVPLDPGTLIPGSRLPKLMIWRPDAAEMFGERIFMLDLDTVIVRSIDSVVDRAEDLVLWENNTGSTLYNTSFVLLSAGARPEVWNRHGGHVEHPDLGLSDQVWVSDNVRPEEATWGVNDKDGLFKGRDLRNGSLPDEARMVTFNGPRDPSMARTRRKYPWIGEHWR